MQSENNGNKIFINGKKQIIELLQMMTPAERTRILNNVRIKNPSLANELIQGTINFHSLQNVSDHELRIIMNKVGPSIWGLALKTASQDFQRRSLSLAPTDYAEESYDLLIRPLNNEAKDAKRAQEKIINLVVQLVKAGQISAEKFQLS